MARRIPFLGTICRTPLLDLSSFDGAVDVFVYDTTLDSDYGAWVSNEPTVMIIEAQAAYVIVRNAEDGIAFKTFDFTGFTVRAVAAMGRWLLVATDQGVAKLDIRDDTTVAIDYSTATSPAIVSDAVNDIAARVLPGAPTDPTTGLKVPTVLVGTDGGLSIIKDNGTVVDVVHSIEKFVNEVGWRESDNAICYAAWANIDGRIRVVRHDVPASDLSLGRAFLAGSGDEIYPMSVNAGFTGSTFPLSSNDNLISRGWIGEADAGSTQLTLFAPEPSAPETGMRAAITTDYNTGWMVGDTRAALLMDTATTDLVGGTHPDRSPFNDPLTVSGTITRTSVAVGADLAWFTIGADSSATLSADISATGFLYWWEEVAGVPRLYAIDLAGGGDYVDGKPGTPPSDSVTLSGTTLTVKAGKTLALVRATNTTPTSAQMAKIYRDEQNLFRVNAKCTLPGTSSNVRSVDYDAPTGRVQALTSDGWFSSWRGLQRMDARDVSKSVALSSVRNKVIVA